MSQNAGITEPVKCIPFSTFAFYLKKDISSFSLIVQASWNITYIKVKF